MNTPVTVLLFFSGTIAFVQDVPEPLKVNALLLRVDEDHQQQLTIPIASLQCKADCKLPCESVIVEGTALCDCPLDGATVSLQTQSGTKPLPYRPPGSLPDETNFGKIDWLLSMWYVKPSAAEVVRGRIPRNVGTQITFGWNEGATCRFEESLCDNERRVWGVVFNTGIFVDPVQAVPELVVFESTVTAPITITRGGQSATLRLNCPGRSDCPILISNSLPSEGNSDELCLPDLCDEKGGDHFREYGRLTDDGLLGLVPERLCERYAPLDNVLPELCFMPRAFGPRTLGDRIICPPTILQP